MSDVKERIDFTCKKLDGDRTRAYATNVTQLVHSTPKSLGWLYTTPRIYHLSPQISHLSPLTLSISPTDEMCASRHRASRISTEVANTQQRASMYSLPSKPARCSVRSPRGGSRGGSQPRRVHPTSRFGPIRTAWTVRIADSERVRHFFQDGWPEQLDHFAQQLQSEQTRLEIAVRIAAGVPVLGHLRDG